MGKGAGAAAINQSERERWAGAAMELWAKRHRGNAWVTNYRRARLTVYVYDELLKGEDLGPVRRALAVQDAAMGLVAVCPKTGQTHWSK